MSVLRKLNVLPQLRVDAPHLRMIESAVAGDFDTVVGKMMAGGKPFVVRGFTLTGTSVGSAANQMALVTADSIAVNLNASESGSFLWIPANRPNETLDSATNGKVTGSFASGVTNYVGIDFKRSPDASTTDLAKFLDADSLSSVKTESTRSIPLGLTLDYRIVISTVPFSSTPNIIPIAKVVTNVNNAISTIIDARPMMYRLATGGDFPNAQNVYSWPFNRVDSPVLSVFSGGDKNIVSDKDWRDAVMSRLWELGGGESWYSPTADRNVRMVYDSGSVFVNGQNFETVSSNLHWRGLSILFDNSSGSGVYYNEIADQLVDSTGLTNLAVGECIYVDIDRTQNLTGVAALVPQKAALQTLGAPVVPGSRFVIAWRTSDAGSFTIWTKDGSYPVDTTFFVAATSSAMGVVKLTGVAATPAAPVVPVIEAGNGITLPGGIYMPGALELGGDVIYNTPPSYITFVPITNFLPFKPAAFELSANGYPYWSNTTANSGATESLIGTFDNIPQGGTITGLRVCLENATGSSKNFTVHWRRVNLTGTSFGAPVSLLTSDPTTVAVGATTVNWFTVALSGTPTIFSAGRNSIVITVPDAAGVANQFFVRGVEITYTVPQVQLSF